MELRDSGKTISFFSRIVFQLPTIALSAISMIAISRNLGPSGRGETSQFLLLASLASGILCTPIFLTIMNLKKSSEIKTYVLGSLFLFNWRNVTLVGILNIYLLLLSKVNSQVFSIQKVLFLDVLITFYFIAAQIRDLLLRFHKNKIYAVDFAVQILISGTVLVFVFFNTLTVSKVIAIFTFAYGLMALFLLIVIKKRVKEFRFKQLVKQNISHSNYRTIGKTHALFSKLGIPFQLALSKDLLFGALFLSKSDFGLMSALASFWVVARFMRPSTVIQAKLGENEPTVNPNQNKGFLTSIFRASAAIYIQAIFIVILGLLSFFLTPIIMGSGFKPSLSMAIAGLTAEVLLMKCLYDLSTSASAYSQKLFYSLSLLQVIFLVLLEYVGIGYSINSIWFSSCILYIIWQAVNMRKCKK